ncbi:flavodoxin [Sneathia sp. DSM 16631]|uniref:flavodoxin n=1 Tax=Sneathia TaxID=168808 RepID=UPI001868DE37|nr:MULTISPECIES: flavodoxin [Sneathia]MBE3031147.1 flavodoxin [Sneathia sp. DSM 16631]MDK9581617.1 flavodoxin [Sneathia vaginalis]
MSVGIFYGTTTGVTEEVAQILCDKIDGAQMFDVANGIDNMNDFDFLIFCSSTWGLGDLQDDWMAVIDDLPKFNGKPVALLGTGDCVAFADTFIDAMRLLYDKCKKNGANIVGMVPTDGYDFVASLAIIDNKFIALPIDHMNEAEKTEERINNWLEILNKYIH